MENKRKSKNESGITLIALIITVIVMLLLAFVAVSSINGFGLFGRVNNAVGSYNKSVGDEEDTINNALGMLDNVSRENDGGGGSGDNTGGGSTIEPEITTPPSPTNTVPSIAKSAGVIEIVWLNTDNQVIENPIAPDIVTNLTPVKWNGTTFTDTTTSDTSWYNYLSQTGANDEHTSMWANARTNNNDYLVWIPRYAYKITYFGGATDQEAINNANYYRANGRTGDFQESWITGYSTVYGMLVKEGNDYKLADGTARNISNKVKTVGYTDYVPHPAFTNEGNNGLGELAGIWVGKYESSNDGSDKIKIVPNVTSWRYITANDIFLRCQEFSTNNSLTTEMDSHMMKNTEWGAVAYLTHSRYGRNGTEVTVNNYFVSDIIKTGYAGGSVSTEPDTTGDNSYLYNTPQGQLASTTGNITGIYDMSGGAMEYTAAYVNNGNSNLTTYYSSLINAAPKYKDVYIVGSLDNRVNNYALASSKYGDAIYETSCDDSCANGWSGGSNSFPLAGSPGFGRGTNVWYSGIFNFFNANRKRLSAVTRILDLVFV